MTEEIIDLVTAGLSGRTFRSGRIKRDDPTMEHHDDWTRFRLGRLDPRRFEELCFALLAAEGHSDLRRWGAAGSESGVDIISRGPDGRCWVTQCKRHVSLSAAGAVPELKKVIDKPPDPLPEVYLLVATCTISRATDEALKDAAQAAPFPLEIATTWDETSLVAMLRDQHPELRERFIGPVEPEKVPFWNVPNRNEYFTGREEILAELATRLEDGRAAALTQAIVGLGGVGKSQTAIEYCHRHRSAYETGVFWVDASSAEALVAHYAEVAQARGLVGREVPVNDAAQALRSYLAAGAGWLMVLDNADEPDAIRHLLPPNTNGHVLVTSRASAPGIGRGKPIAVDVLPLNQATDLLLDRGRRQPDERAAAQELAVALGQLPLALEQAGAYLNHQQVAIGDYLASFRRRRLDLLERFGPEQGEYHATVATTWEISFQKVERESPAAAEALSVCGFLAPDRIPVQLFVGTDELLGPALGALEIAEEPLALHERLIEPLTRYSLARYDPEDGGALSFHRLVQEVIRRRAQAEGREPEVYEQAHRAMETCFPEDPQSPAAWSAASLWLPHVQSLLTIWKEQTEEPTWDPTSLWSRAAMYAKAAGRMVGARELIEEVPSVSRRVLGEEHPSTLISMNNLAETLRALGETSGARELHEEVLSVRRRVLGEEHPSTLISMHNLCVTQEESEGMEVDSQMVESLLRRVRRLPEGTPIRVAAEARWAKDQD
jgi:hypothetical protein